MAFIDKDSKTVSFKIVYCGAPLSGKTTNVQHVHECLDSKTRGELISISTSEDRTLFFDFLAVEAAMPNGYKAKFYIFTVPGQVVYNATYQLVLKQADGLIFVVDSQLDRMQENVQAWSYLEHNLKNNEQSLSHIPLVIQYNKSDLPNAAPVEYMEYLFNQREIKFRSWDASASQGYNVLNTLNEISQQVLHNFLKQQEATTESPQVQKQVPVVV